ELTQGPFHLLVGLIEFDSGGPESLRGRRCRLPPPPERLDHRQGLQRLRGVAQPLVGAMEPLPLLFGEVLGSAVLAHWATGLQNRAVTTSSPSPFRSSPGRSRRSRPDRRGTSSRVPLSAIGHDRPPTP